MKANSYFTPDTNPPVTLTIIEAWVPVLKETEDGIMDAVTAFTLTPIIVTDDDSVFLITNSAYSLFNPS
jgi:hypothetical protein